MKSEFNPWITHGAVLLFGMFMGAVINRTTISSVPIPIISPVSSAHAVPTYSEGLPWATQIDLSIEALKNRVDWLEKQENLDTLRGDNHTTRIHDLELVERSCKPKL